MVYHTCSCTNNLNALNSFSCSSPKISLPKLEEKLSLRVDQVFKNATTVYSLEVLLPLQRLWELMTRQNEVSLLALWLILATTYLSSMFL